jgi:basic membrane protein A
MKKVGIILLAVFVLLSFACQRQGDTVELVLITDIGTIDDRSFNQGSWEGLLQYALEHNISHRYFQPPEQSDRAYLNTIDLAVRGGARVIVTPGFLFSSSIFDAQDRYPNVRFILVDAEPRKDGVTRVGSNTVAVLYAEDQAGFLAGYAAVREGFRRLGFMGGMAVPAVVRFGYGFVQGAEYAARDLGLAPGSVTINYHYTGGFSATPEVQTMAASWYMAGVEVIFACGGALGNSVMAAAEATGNVVIGVDIDQSDQSRTVITSAMKMLQYSVYSSITAYYQGRFPGGETRVFDAANYGVGLPMATSRFRNFTQANYDSIFRRLAAGEFPRMVNLAEGGDPSAVPVNIANVTFIR